MVRARHIITGVLYFANVIRRHPHSDDDGSCLVQSPSTPDLV